MSDKPFYNERDANGRRLVSEFVAERDDTQVRAARRNKESVFKQFIIGWRVLWAEAFRIKESYGRHPSVHELLSFFQEDYPDIPPDEVELRFRITLQTVESMGLLVTTMGSVDGNFCQVLVNIKNPRTTEAVIGNEDATDGSETEETKKVNLDKV